MSLKRIEMKYGRIVPSIETPAVVIANGKKVNVIAVWDTGSTHTAITPCVANELGAPLHGGVNAHTMGGYVNHKFCTVSLELGGYIRVTGDILCSPSSLSSDGRIGLIIGMDIISLGDFSIKSRSGKTIMTFEAENK